MPDIASYIDPAVAAFMRDSIREAGGNEIFFLGACGPDRRVMRAEVAARGDDSCVPAVSQDTSVGDVVIHNHPSGLLTPSAPDLDIAASLGARGVGFLIVDNAVEQVYAVVEPFARETLKPVDIAGIVSALSAGGALARVMKGYEPRPGQVTMAAEVARAFNGNKVAALEAGTGVGKSMAYLIPSLLWILNNKERVVVSTNTINLQEQLIVKDIPLLSRAFPEPFKAVLVKGRGNYLCLRNLDAASGEGDFLLEPGEKEDLAAIHAWSENTKEGSLSDLNFVPNDELWEKLRSESDTCTRLKCRHFQHCFFFRARREAASADILVVNHHILLADIALRSEAGGTFETGILPGYSRLIIDEGHNMEDGATSYFGMRVSRLGLLKSIGRLHHKRDRERGVLPFLTGLLRAVKGSSKDRADAWVSAITSRILSEKESAALRVNEAFDLLYYFAEKSSENSGGEVKLRLKEGVKNSSGWAEVDAAFERLGGELLRLVRSLSTLRRELEATEGLSERLTDPVVEMKALSERLENTAEAIAVLMKGGDDGLVRWVEAPAKKAGRVISLCGSPLNVASEIKARVYDRLQTVVITSATLTVKKKFDFIARRTGLELLPEGRLVTGIYPSPFDYSRQVIIGIPKDIPEPTDKDFGRALVGLVRESLEASRGRAFVLFTSYRLLNQVYSELQLDMAGMGIKGLRQGDSPRHNLLSEFKSHPSAALFGTESFWEGVDVMGEALSSVIITKLPFSVPDDPVIEARQEEITARGGNPFMEYIVPQAVIKFRQGFGRLIRSKSDRGSILVFDRRVVEKNYGREFLDSLPEGKVVTGSRDMVFEKVHEFFTPEMA